MPQPVKVALLTFVILLCVGIPLSSFRGSLEKINQRSFLTPVYSYLDLKKPNDLKVIFLGSSRILSCINKDLFAKLSGIEQSKILILDVNGSGTWEELAICRRHPELFESSPLVIIEVEPWMFNENYFSTEDSLFLQPGFFTWASFQDRLEFPDIKSKFLLLADYFWPFSERRTPDVWGYIINAAMKGRRSKPLDPDEPPEYHYNLSAYKKVADDPKGTAQFQANGGLNNFRFAEYKAEYLKRLINLADKKANNIVILQPPLRKEYIDVLYNNSNYLDGYIKVLRFIHSLENRKVHSITWETSKDCGLNDSVFIDYGHFNAQGAYVFTQRLFHELKVSGLVETKTISGTGADSSPEENILRIEEALKIKPDSINTMQRLAIAYSNKGYFEKALAVLNRMKELQPDNADVYYNIACINAKQNRVNESIEWLKMAITKGFNNRNLLVTDKDLDNIKGSQDFKKLLIIVGGNK